MHKLSDTKIAIIGLGYVGLPLAVAFSKKYNVTGYDINLSRIDELESGIDRTLEVSKLDLERAVNLSFSSSKDDLKLCNTFIVTVPTPIDRFNQPDLTPLLKASELLGGIIKKDDVIIFESTVYPGATEDDCIPIVEKISGLFLNKEFFAGYSPERINPGDKEHRVEDILKVTSGSNESAAQFVDNLYGSIINAGTHKASSIRVAEAAKVIENTQRDVNIALINELAIIFDKLDIDTSEVLDAAGTKWNFLPFRPGLVGGHCIGVDPYYLTHKSQSVGYHPEIILAGRRINDGMAKYAVSKLIKEMVNKKIEISSAKILVMGLAFKENCPDIRNSKVIDIIMELQGYGVEVNIYDPWINPDIVMSEYGFEMNNKPDINTFGAIILAVGHDDFKHLGADKIREYGTSNHIFYDLKSIFNIDESDLRL